MDGQAENDLLQKIIEAASTRPLGWILEYHCKMQLADKALEVVFDGTNRVAREMLYEGETLQTLQQIVRSVLGQDMAVRILDTPTGSNVAIHNQLAEPFRGAKIIYWNGLPFRSHAEVRIAEALDRRKVLFFPNCKGRLGFKERENREPDFLICYEGKWGILEVDGGPSHPPSRTVDDHERDRLFLAHGIPLVQHFDAGECWENADGVVKKFLELLKKTR